MANSVAAVYIDDELAEPKILKAVHRLWSDLPFVQVQDNARVLCVKVMYDRGAPGSPSTFTVTFSGHDCYGLNFLPGLEGGGITTVQFDTEGGGSGKVAKSLTRGGSLDGADDTSLTRIDNGFEDIVLGGSDVILISYDVNATDFSSLLDEAFLFPIPPLP